MKKISVDQIENGMILGRDVCAASGSILLGAGTALTASLGRRLKNWGIPVVHIEGDDEDQEQVAASDMPPEQVREHLEHKFSNVKNDPIMKTLFKAVCAYRLGKDAAAR
jgi:hypothetical protein